MIGSDYLRRLIYRVAMKGCLEDIKLWLNLESREGDNQEKTWTQQQLSPKNRLIQSRGGRNELGVFEEEKEGHVAGSL